MAGKPSNFTFCTCRLGCNVSIGCKYTTFFYCQARPRLI